MKFSVTDSQHIVKDERYKLFGFFWSGLLNWKAKYQESVQQKNQPDW